MKRVLFIGQGLFCDGLTRLLSDFPLVEIIGAVQTCVDARQVIIQERPNVLIVDHAQISLSSADLNSLLESADSLKVISLTLLENKMIVHDRRQLGDVTLPVLLQVLQVSNPVHIPEECAG